MPFTVAWKSNQNEITYRDKDGNILIKKGGTRSWRNNNPGNIIDSPFSDAHGAIGGDGRMAIFPDEIIGKSAIIKLITGPKYRSLSIRDAIYRYAPPSDNNNTDKYIESIVRYIKLPATTAIEKLSESELSVFADAIKRHEGWRAGEVVEGDASRHLDAATSTSIDARIYKLIELGTDTKKCEALRYAGRKAMIRIYGEITSKNACAATLSVFLQAAGFKIDSIEYGAGKIANYVENKLNWRRIKVGEQQPGDIGVCRDDNPSPPGPDHVFFVTERVTADEMMIVDNQEKSAPHPRFASGKGGKTPVDYFLTLRPDTDATSGIIVNKAITTDDQKTDHLIISYTDYGIKITS